MALFVRDRFAEVVATFGSPADEDSGVRMGREFRSPGVSAKFGPLAFRPRVHSPASSEVLEVGWDAEDGSYSILLDSGNRQYRVSGIHVPYVREGYRVAAGDALGSCRGFRPTVHLQESSGRYYSPGATRAPKCLRRADCYWDSVNPRRIAAFLKKIDAVEQTYSWRG